MSKLKEQNRKVNNAIRAYADQLEALKMVQIQQERDSVRKKQEEIELYYATKKKESHHPLTLDPEFVVQNVQKEEVSNKSAKVYQNREPMPAWLRKRLEKAWQVAFSQPVNTLTALLPSSQPANSNNAAAANHQNAQVNHNVAGAAGQTNSRPQLSPTFPLGQKSQDFLKTKRESQQVEERENVIVLELRLYVFNFFLLQHKPTFEYFLERQFELDDINHRNMVKYTSNPHQSTRDEIRSAANCMYALMPAPRASRSIDFGTQLNFDEFSL